MAFIARSLEHVLRRAAREFPAVVLTGPRQSGKTTLFRHTFGKRCRYVSLEAPDVRAVAREDPRGFLRDHGTPLILDEVQNAPELLPYIKEHIDEDRSARGRFLLTGSQNLLLTERITETLAGRAAVLRLLPFSAREAAGEPHAPLPWEKGGGRPRRAGWQGDLWENFLRGWYPELVAESGRDVRLWHASYVQTYLERDVRTLRQVGDLTSFQNFLRVLAARSGQMLNLSDVARDLGIAVNTVKAWLSVLEASYQVLVLRPYFENTGKRLVKAPKIYFTDVGTLCYLTGLRDPEHAVAGPMGGPIFETAVLMEIYKTILHRGEEPELYFWRTSRGSEVDLLVRHGDKLIPIEVKLSATPRPAMADGIRDILRDLHAKAAEGYVVHPGDVEGPLGAGARALSFRRL